MTGRIATDNTIRQLARRVGELEGELESSRWITWFLFITLFAMTSMCVYQSFSYNRLQATARAVAQSYYQLTHDPRLDACFG